MTLQEAETRLSELDKEISVLLKEREKVIKEWNTAFNEENPKDIYCIDENTGGFHELYLINGESKLYVCHLSERNINDNINDFYKMLDNTMAILNVANGRDYESLEYLKRLVYAKAIEIREALKQKS